MTPNVDLIFFTANLDTYTDRFYVVLNLLQNNLALLYFGNNFGLYEGIQKYFGHHQLSDLIGYQSWAWLKLNGNKIGPYPQLLPQSIKINVIPM